MTFVGFGRYGVSMTTTPDEHDDDPGPDMTDVEPDEGSDSGDLENESEHR